MMTQDEALFALRCLVRGRGVGLTAREAQIPQTYLSSIITGNASLGPRSAGRLRAVLPSLGADVWVALLAPLPTDEGGAGDEASA